MAVDKLFIEKAIILPSLGSITQLSDVGASKNHSEIIRYSAAAAGPQFTGTEMTTPDLVATSPQVKTLLDATKNGNHKLARDLSGGNTDIEYQQRENLQSRIATGTASHLRARMASNAFLSWQTLNAPETGDATMRFRILPIDTGSGNPLVFTASQTLAASDAADEVFRVGPIKLNGSFINGVKSWDWDTRVTYREDRCESEKYLTFAGVDTFAHTITAEISNTERMLDYGADGIAVSSFLIFLRRFPRGGGVYADNELQHIKITGTQGTVMSTESRGMGGRTTLRFLIEDISAIDTASTIA